MKRLLVFDDSDTTTSTTSNCVQIGRSVNGFTTQRSTTLSVSRHASTRWSGVSTRSTAQHTTDVRRSTSCLLSVASPSRNGSRSCSGCLSPAPCPFYLNTTNRSSAELPCPILSTDGPTSPPRCLGVRPLIVSRQTCFNVTTVLITVWWVSTCMAWPMLT